MSATTLIWSHRIIHERCLWAIYSMDFESLDVLLGEWHVEECDPVWMIRKAALLRESDHRDEAAELGRACFGQNKVDSR